MTLNNKLFKVHREVLDGMEVDREHTCLCCCYSDISPVNGPTKGLFAIFLNDQGTCNAECSLSTPGGGAQYNKPI